MAGFWSTCCVSSLKSLEKSFELGRRHGAHAAGDFLAVPERDQSRDPTNAESLASHRILVGVELHHQHLSRAAVRDVIQQRRHDLARPAPIGVEVTTTGTVVPV